MIIKKVFKLTGMHCTSCAMNIEGELEDAGGIGSATASYAQNLVEVEYDNEKITDADIIAIIQKTGYQAQLN